MYTAEEVDALRARLEAEGVSRPNIVKGMAWACVGWPYVFGAAGVPCVPDERRKYARYNPQYATNIYNACPNLKSGGKNPCSACQWDGRLCFDCEGFPRWLMAQVGLQIYGAGATTQWETASNWAATGTIDSLPTALVCCLFKRKEGKMSHEGLHVCGGEIVHCSTTVKPDALPGRPAWTHWAVPAGLYTDEELKEAGIAVESAKNTPTLRRGASGPMVATLQTMLNQLSGAGLDVDGKFGAKTESALIHFQGLHDLKEDGIAGPKTWNAMGVGAAMDGPVGDPEEWDAPEDEAGSPAADAPETAADRPAGVSNTTTAPGEPEQREDGPPATIGAEYGIFVSLDDWRAMKAAFAALSAVIHKYE